METVLKDQYVQKKEIGSGAYGRVYLAEDIINKKNVAIKRLKRSEIDKDEYLKKALDKEIEIMKLCHCENSVILIEDFQTTNNYNFVMELCDGDLDGELKSRKKPFTEEELKLILRQLSNVFVIMDRENIIHRDIKHKNFLVKKDPNNPNNKLGFIVKIADFGFSKVMENDMTRSVLGTPSTMAPEVLSKSEYSKKADLWSVGVITYQLLFNSLPFNGRSQEEILQTILKSKEIMYPNTNPISRTLKHLINNLLQKDPNKRYNWKEFLNHPFLGLNTEIEKINLQGQIPFANFEDKYYGTRKLSEDTVTDYGIVLAKNKITNEYVLIKEVKKDFIEKNELYKKIFLKEVTLLKELQEDFFIKLIEVFANESSYFIVTEYFEGKTLEIFLQEKGKALSEAFVKKLLRQIAVGVKYLMDRKIILEFISPQSFCFFSYDNEDSFKIKFFDYGLSSIYNDNYYQQSYLLNEGVPGEIRNQKTNILSLGLTAFKLLFGDCIYKFSESETIEESMTNLKSNFKLNIIDLLHITKLLYK